MSSAPTGSREDAEKALAERTLKIERPKPRGTGFTFAQAVDRYLAAKARKRTIDEDRRILGHLEEHFGKDTALAEITASRISEYKGHRFHYHGLRHTFASWAVQRGATLQEVKDLLGHSSLAMVMRYAHLSPEHLRTAVARLDAALPTGAGSHCRADHTSYHS